MAGKQSLPAPRPTISVPPRPPVAAMFGPCASPGPLTLVSSFFAESDCGSFSELLAGAMYSPLAVNASGASSFLLDYSRDNPSKEGEFRDGQASLAVAKSPLFTVPPGLSPSGLLLSPGFFSPKSPFGMSHQQALAQVTAQAQAALARSHEHSQLEMNPLEASKEPLPDEPSFMLNEDSQQLSPSDATTSMTESCDFSSSSQKWEALPTVLEKPTEDGYNWRKYGQKQVKGCGYPRSYYKCSHLNCSVKKKVEHSLDGRITEITYRGQHQHEIPQGKKTSKDGNNLKRGTNSLAKSQAVLQDQNGRQSTPAMLGSGRDRESSQAINLHTSGLSNYVELDDAKSKGDGSDGTDDVDAGDDEPNPKRRIVPIPSSKYVSEPKIVLQTRSEVDLLDDGFKWRKYGQKVVKGSSYPRSYYKCTYAGCNVRKHVERAASDPKSVITTYEGKHTHTTPSAGKRGRTVEATEFGEVQRPSVLRLKEEQVAA
ncbi:probable WRKY transcription factor 3 [Rhodamnia argentea]|uniref:Probable WRKY transcription factor 3 n=1 Tax=Rhodamnia argentea TaxID=178133 RepID=A0A8B8MUI6_9MYRT|nr:probable WRKY transcription factor 3 [Rhodamnia argentea]